MWSMVLFVLFLLLMIGIGLWGMRKTGSLSDFFIGGRKIGPWVSALAYGTTYFSAVLFIGFAGKLGWGFGLRAVWIGLGNAVIGAFLAWLVLGARTRIMTHNLDAMTMPEFFQARFGSGFIKPLAAIIIFVFLLPYSASVYKGLGHLFEAGFGISYDGALILMTVVTGIYLVLGGYFAVTLTDFIQGLIMIGGSIAMIVIMAGKAGGLGEVIGTIAERYPQHVPPAKQPPTLLLASLVFMTSFGVWGLPQMVQKFYAVRDAKVILRAAIVTGAFATIIGLAAYFNGAMSHAFLDKPPLGATGKPDYDRMIPDLLKANIPEALMALIMLLVLSASMSTLSSLVLVSSSAIAIDLYKGYVNPDVTAKGSLRMMRILTGVFVLVSLALSFVVEKKQVAIIVTLMSLSWGAVAGAFMAPFFYSLFWRRVTLASVYAGMATGLGLAVGLFYYLGPDRSPMAASIAMLGPFVVIPIISAFGTPPAAALVDKAFSGIGQAASPPAGVREEAKEYAAR